jgi:hypothetical protein
VDVTEVAAPLGCNAKVAALDEAQLLGDLADAAVAERFVVAFVSADEVGGVPALVPLSEVLDAPGRCGAAEQGEGGDEGAHGMIPEGEEGTLPLCQCGMPRGKPPT